VVDFIGGCPDRPLVLGRVYNANNMPPVELPASANQSGFRSQSVYGDPTMCNKMIFDDTLGSELVHQRAQKDMCDEVVNNHDHTIGANYTVDVCGQYSITAGSLRVHVKRTTDLTLDGQTTVNMGAYDRTIEGVVIKKTTGDVDTTTKGTLTATQDGMQKLKEIGDIDHSLKGAYKSKITGDVKIVIDGNVG